MGNSAENTNIPKEENKQSYFNRLVFLINYVPFIALLISYLSPYISPENFWFLAFFGLAYPVLLLINLLFVIYWFITWKRYIFLSLFAIFAGWIHLKTLVQINLSGTPVDTADTSAIKVLSYNVRLFDLYNWSHNKETRDKIFDLIKEESPNIMCLQEFYADDTKEFNTLDTLVELQDAKNYHVEYSRTLRKVNHWGIATFTNYPIISKGMLTFQDISSICIYTDVKIKEDTVRIYNMHLQSIHFQPDDYKFVDDLVDDKQTKKLENSKNIMKRLKIAFAKRSVQADAVAEHIRQSPYPVIVCGDFNDTPSSYTYHTISENLNDAFVKSGNGFERTYIGTFPSFRIDYILYNNKFKSYDFHTIKERLSDHLPVSCILEMKN